MQHRLWRSPWRMFHSASLDKMAAISQCIFVNTKIGILIKVSLQFVPEGAINNHRSSIGLNYGLTPNRRPAIIWTNAEPFYWRIYAALGLGWGRVVLFTYGCDQQAVIYDTNAILTNCWLFQINWIGTWVQLYTNTPHHLLSITRVTRMTGKMKL